MRKTILLLLAGVFITNIQAQELKLAKGQKFQLTSTVKTNSTQQMMGQSVEFSNDITTQDEFIVDAKDAQSISLSKTTKQMKTAFSGMGQNISFDSNNPEDMNGPIGSQLKDLINKPLTFVLNLSGTIASTPKLAGNAMTGAISDIAKGEILPGFIALPASLKAGDNFSITGADGDNKSTTNYTVTAINGQEAVLKITTTANKTSTVNQMGMDMLMTMKMTTTGSATVDISTGLVLNSTTEMNTDGTINVMGQSVPMTVKTTTSITGKRL